MQDLVLEGLTWFPEEGHQNRVPEGELPSLCPDRELHGRKLEWTLAFVGSVN